jgi:hypothetical protein
MILHYQDIPKSNISFHTKLKYSDNCSFIPISFKNNHAIQTPMMYIPYGIFTNENNKRFLDITFYNIDNDTILRDFYNSLKKIFRIIQKKYKNIKVNSFLKNTIFGDSLRLKIDQNALFFNEAKQKIDTVKSNYYGRFLISLYGLWIINDQIWVQWILLQAKMIEPVFFKSLLIDETIIPNNKHIQKNKNIPPPPPLPQFKNYDPKIKIVKKNKTIKKTEKHFDVPTIEELKTILSNLKKSNLRENKI